MSLALALLGIGLRRLSITPAAVGPITAVPLLLSGKAAQAAADLLRSAGFSNVAVVGYEIGRASAIKMIRSVMVKGIEALTAEMMLGAESAGVTAEVLASLDSSEKALPWAERAEYNIERMITHGLRRAAEMEESAKTLASLNHPHIAQIYGIETSGDVRALADLIAKLPHLRLRGLMLLPQAGLDADALRMEYRAARALFDQLSADALLDDS